MTPTRRPSPSLFISALALLVACSGTAYAAGRAQPGDAIIQKQSLSGNRLKPDTVTGRQVREGTLSKVPAAGRANVAGTARDLPDPRFRALTLMPGWVPAAFATAAPGVATDLEGFVHLRGAVSSSGGAGSLLTVLPVWARPATRVYLPVYTTGGTPGSVSVEPTGEIYLINGSNAFVSLEGIRFSAVP